MSRTVHYVFDPLCGWCYGASAAVAALGEAPDVQLVLRPSGLFQDAGARPLDDAFAAYAWSNDQRIERLTGQPFSQRYRDQVLGDRVRTFDSGPATLALTAVWLTAPEREVQALQAFQQARFVAGEDITRIEFLATTLASLGLADAARQLRDDEPALRAAVDTRVAEAQALMRHAGARGVPSFIRESGDRRQLLRADLAFSDPGAFLAQLAAA